MIRHPRPKESDTVINFLESNGYEAQRTSLPHVSVSSFRPWLCTTHSITFHPFYPNWPAETLYWFIQSECVCIAWETDHTSWHHHWFPLKWCLRNNHRNSILMTCHYPDLDSASDSMKQFFNQSEALPGSGCWCIVSVEFLLSFLRHHFVGKPMVESWIVGCFLRPLSVENRRLCSQGAVTQHKLQQHLAFTFSVAFITSHVW